MTPALPGLFPEAVAAPAPAPVRERRSVSFVVRGEPRGMGSKSAFAYIGKDGKPHAVVTDKPSKAGHLEGKLTSWKDSVTAAAMVETAFPPDAALAISITFELRRPAGHYGKGKREGQLLPSAPPFPHHKPDMDKLVRATLDAIKTGGLVADDSRFVRINLEKRYADLGAPTGAAIYVEEL